MSEMKFGDFQRDERFKKLERTLKLANVRKAYRKESADNETWTDATSPSISSINPDPFDSSAAGPSLHTSRIGSEVVASSNNLRNILLKKHNYMSHKAIATSSIKQYRMSGNESDDRRIMPPPSFDRIPRTSKSVTKALGHDVPRLTPMVETNIHVASDIDTDSERDTSHSLKNVPNNFCNRSSRIFSNWRVLLNAQGQLIIKGTLEDGRIARSKPVIERLTSTSVESIYKHVYHLRGSIVDIRSELPDYVRGKFCNGFPDDWQNVHQIWKSFIQEGCPVTFRWPTPISDSDDDLRSDITDLTVSRRKNSNGKTVNSMSIEYLPNALQTETPKQGARRKNFNVNDSFTQTDISGTDGNVLCDNDEVPVDQDSRDKENFNQNNLNHADNSRRINKITDILKEDKLNVIINNLKDKNCPQEYINKIVQMYDCVNYFISHNSSMDEQSISRDRTTEEQRCQLQEYTNDNSHGNSPDCYPSESILRQSNTCCNNLTSDKGIFPETGKSSNEHLDESESETYAGIPKIPAEKILRQRETLIRPYKHKSRKKPTHPDYQMYDDAKNRCISHVLPIQTCTPSQMLKQWGSSNPDDTSVSITEDELGFSNDRKASHSGLQNNYNKQQSDITKTRPREKLDILSRGMREMQVHPTQENEKLPNKLYNNTYNLEARGKINDDINNQQCEKKTMIKTSPGKKLERYERCEFPQMSEEHSTQSKDPKSTIISSVPVNTNFRLKVHANNLKGNTIDSKSDGRSNEESNNKNSMQKSSLLRNTSSEKNINPTLTMGTDPPDHPVTQATELNCNTPKQIALDHSKNVKTHEYEHDAKPKVLSDWTPKVVCISKTNCEFGLIFEGNLLNDAGHVVHKKFVTDIVLRRNSRRLFETKDHETYRLVGDLKDTKHVVPKELQKLCRSGCPTQIEEFCNKWVSSKIGNVNDFSKSSDELCNSVDILNIPMSSKGRKILPPLSYWTGERIIVKGDQTVYSPGSSKEYSTTSSLENPSTPRKRKSATRQGKNTSGQSNSDESKVTANKTEEKSTSAKRMTNNSEDSKNQEPAPKYSRKTSRRFLSPSDDSSGEEYSSVRKRQKLNTNKNPLPSTVSPKKSNDQLMERRVNPPRRTKKLSESGETRNTNINTSPVGSPNVKNPQSSTRRLRDRICTYYQDIPLEDDTLSDDQVSQV